MRSQIEDDIHVGLVQTQVEACAVEVEKPPEVTSLDELTKLVDGRIVLEGVARHEHHTGRVSRVDYFLGGARGRGQRFLDEDMLTGGDGFQPQHGVTGRRGRDDDRVEVRQGVVQIGVGGNSVLGQLRTGIDPGKPLVYRDNVRYPGR